MTSINIGFKVIKRASANPQGLRWMKADSGQSITWSYDFSNNINLNYTDDQLTQTVAYQFRKIKNACNINFQRLGQGVESNIKVFFEHIDGPSNYLAFVYQPSSGTDMDSHPLLGDIHMDNAESYSLIDFGNIMFHEALHSMGLPHDERMENSEFSVMRPYYSFGSPEFQLGPWDIKELRIRYPY